MKKIVAIVLLGGVSFGNTYAGTAYPGPGYHPGASQESLDALEETKTVINEVSEICGTEDIYNYADDKVFIDKINTALDTLDYAQIITIKSKLYGLFDDIVEKLIPMESGNITKYNKKFISNDSYDKGYEFLSSNYGYDDDNEINYVLGAGCNPYVLLRFRGLADDNFFTQEKDYQRYKLIIGLQSIIRNYLEANFYPSNKYTTTITLLSLDGIELGEEEYSSKSNVIGDYVLDKGKYASLMDEYLEIRISDLIGNKYSKEISGYKRNKNPKYIENCELEDLFSSVIQYDESTVEGTEVECDQRYIKEDMNFQIEIEFLPNI